MKNQTLAILAIVSVCWFVLWGCSPSSSDEDASTGTTNSTFSDNNTTFVVTVSAGKYFLDNVQGKTLTLKKGYTYNFDTQDSSTGSHPFYLGTGSTGGNYADEYTSGVTNSRTTSGILNFVVPQDAPKELYYNCGAHSNMGAAITIVD
jgi:hypothetical protein